MEYRKIENAELRVENDAAEGLLFLLPFYPNSIGCMECKMLQIPICRGVRITDVGTGLPDGPKIFSTSMGENISIPPAFRTKSSHRGEILFWTVREAGPYMGANDNLKQLDKPEFNPPELRREWSCSRCRIGHTGRHG